MSSSTIHTNRNDWTEKQFPFLQPGLLNLETLRDLSQPHPLKGIALVFFDWLIIISAILLSEWIRLEGFTFWFLAYIGAVVIIGSRMMAFGTLAHDGSHWLLHKNKLLNDVVAEVFASSPVFVSLHDYRRDHLIHHKYLRSEFDTEMPLFEYTEYHFPKKPLRMALIFFLDITGINFIYYFIRKFSKGSKAINFNNSVQQEAIQRTGRSNKLIRYMVYAAIIALSIVFNFWLLILMYWIVPFITWFAFTMRMRMIAEHFQVPATAQYKSRTTVTNFLEGFFISPHNLSYHIEHHLYPSIPCYRLREVHELMKQTPQYKENGHITYGFRKLFSELVHPAI